HGGGQLVTSRQAAGSHRARRRGLELWMTREAGNRISTKRRSPSQPNSDEILARHGYTKVIREPVKVSHEVALQLRSLLGIACSGERSRWTIGFDEQVPDSLAARHAQGCHAFLKSKVKFATEQLTQTLWLAPLEGRGRRVGWGGGHIRAHYVEETLDGSSRRP